jgi:hypothetical protein
MARTAKPWFNPQRNCWMVWLNGHRVVLGSLFVLPVHELLEEPGDAPVRSLIDRPQSRSSNSPRAFSFWFRPISKICFVRNLLFGGLLLDSLLGVSRLPLCSSNCPDSTAGSRRLCVT